ncbi:MAG: hypothetical protein NVS9B15_14650 [Acidobacteriaceae bacterium]
MAVVAGDTVMVPPVEDRGYELLSTLSVTTTVEALDAVTVTVELCPEVMLAGFALMFTVGVGVPDVTLIDSEEEKNAPEESHARITTA